jgi:hypothetical protein
MVRIAHCKLCDSKILKPDVATSIDEDHELPDRQGQNRTFSSWWTVNDMFAL